MEPSQASASGQPLIQASKESSTAAAKQTEAAGKAAKVPFSALPNITPSKQPVTPAPKSHWRLEDGDRPSRALQVVHELHSRCVVWQSCSLNTIELAGSECSSGTAAVGESGHPLRRQALCAACHGWSHGVSHQQLGWQSCNLVVTRTDDARGACSSVLNAATVRDGRLPAWCYMQAGSHAGQGFLLRGCIAICCRYMKQTQRWRDYAKLFTFLGFVALFLSVLYLQRGAQTAYEVRPGCRVD